MTREEFMDIVYSELHSDDDNYRANRIIDAADEYVEEQKEQRGWSKMIDISQEDFGTLCICALRYCHGRRTYMPSLIQEIVGRHLEEFSDKTIKAMVDDCQFQRDMSLYGDECDKIDWLKWEQKVKDEQTRRTIEDSEVEE